MIFLYGAPASGKSTLGKTLSKGLGARFVDLDEAIVRKAGASIPEIFASSGEASFRDIESKTLKETIASSASSSSMPSSRRSAFTIVSLGGGTLLREDNRRLCEENGAVFCIDSPSDEELARRIGSAAGARPLGNKARERAPHYASFHNRIAAWFELENSLVVVGNGIASPIISGVPVVADATVEGLWAGRLGISPLATIPSGESFKTPQTVMGLWSAFANGGLGRKDVVAALGGGVTGDLTGFAAATFMRGIDWINIPTTLLSMVDASTGGKTGCDLPEGKNLAGAFHSPRVVAIDADFLETLPPHLLSAGRAEMVKHEIIGGLEPSGNTAVPTPAEIARNLAVKVGVVRDDPFERTGRRILLNCGHTVAHAVETLSEYRVSHGEAVAIGCVEEARLAVRMGLAAPSWPDELAARFAAWNLPVTLPQGIAMSDMAPVMKRDKKRAGGIVTFALPCGWGDVRGVPVDIDKEVIQG